MMDFPWAYTFYYHGELITVFSRLSVINFEEKYHCWVIDIIFNTDLEG